MDRFPVETWTRIFVFACVDGGRTGCALSETCKYFRDAVLPVQVHSVALLGATKMSLFLHEVLESRPPEQRRVQHLFLSQGREMEKVSLAVLQSILRHVGPTLRTLTTLLTQDFIHISHASVLFNPLPCLEELTTHGAFVQRPVAQRAQMQKSLPSLKYLHLLSVCDTALLFIPRAPNLTHLRLSGILSLSDELHACLTQAIDPSAVPSPAVVGKDIPRLSKLESLVVVPHLGATRIVQTNAQQNARRAALRRLKDMDKQHKVDLVESPYHQAVDGSPSKQAERNHWEERNQGGAGCWAVANTRTGERGVWQERNVTSLSLSVHHKLTSFCRERRNRINVLI